MRTGIAARSRAPPGAARGATTASVVAGVEPEREPTGCASPRRARRYVRDGAGDGGEQRDAERAGRRRREAPRGASRPGSADSRPARGRPRRGGRPRRARTSAGAGDARRALRQDPARGAAGAGGRRPAGRSAGDAVATVRCDVRFTPRLLRDVASWRRSRAGAAGERRRGRWLRAPGSAAPDDRGGRVLGLAVAAEQPSEPASAGAAPTPSARRRRPRSKEAMLRSMHRNPWVGGEHDGGVGRSSGGELRVVRAGRGAARPTRTSPSAAR